MKLTVVSLFAFALPVLLSCRQEPVDDYILTVGGPVPVQETGQWLSHEHVLVDWIGADSTGYHRWDRDSVLSRVLPFFREIEQLGVKCFVDCTPAYLGRDPYLLKTLSGITGIHIITNTGYYGAVDNRFIPGHAWDETADEIAARWILEFENGIDGSGIKPGFVKIGVKEEGSLSDLHQKLVRAAALTHLKTGLPVKSHTGGDIPAFEQIGIFRQEGVSPGAFIWTHAQNGSLEKQIEAARAGAWISLDGVNISSDPESNRGNMDWYAGRLTELKEAGVLDQVLISHDAGWYDVGEPMGGGFRHYNDIHFYLIPELSKNGFTEEEIDRLLSVNPARAFAIRRRTIN
jgi:phosphotriesterase-related protein